ncbi:unnamed protein product, partial [Nesidiocoris tenuis]
MEGFGVRQGNVPLFHRKFKRKRKQNLIRVRKNISGYPWNIIYNRILKLGSHGVRLTGSGRYGRPLIGRRESARGAVAVVKGGTLSHRPMRGRPDPVNRTPCEQSFSPAMSRERSISLIEGHSFNSHRPQFTDSLFIPNSQKREEPQTLKNCFTNFLIRFLINT